MKKSELKSMIRTIIREGDNDGSLSPKDKAAIKKVVSMFKAQIKGKIDTFVRDKHDGSYNSQDTVKAYKEEAKIMSYLNDMKTVDELNSKLSKWHNGRQFDHLTDFFLEHLPKISHELHDRIELT